MPAFERPWLRSGRLPVLAVALGLAIALAACGRGEPEIESAVASALGRDLGMADDEVRCLTQALVQEVDLDDLRDRTIGATPSTGPEVVDGPAGDPAGMVALAPRAAGRCVALEDRLIDLVDRVGGRLEPDCVEPGRLDTWPLVGVLLRPVDEVGSLDDLPGQATVQLLDAVRDCVDRSTLASLAGLDDPDRLARVLIADPFARSRLVADQDPCIVEATMDTLGIERLARIGVDLDQPDLFTVRAQLDDDDIASLIGSFAACDLDRQLLRAISVTDEQIGPCILDGVTPGTEPQLVAGLYDGIRIVDDTILSRPADRCATVEVERWFPASERTGDTDEADVGITALARPYLYLWPHSGRYEQACLPIGLESVTAGRGVGTVARAIEATEHGVLTDPPARAAERAYLAEVNEVLTVCVRPWARVLPWLWSAEIDPESFACVRAETDEEIVERAMAAYGPAVWEGDAEARPILAEGLGAVADGIRACSTEADLGRWQAFAATIAG